MTVPARFAALVLCAAALAALPSCKKEEVVAAKPAPGTPAAGGHHGPATELGETTIGSWKVRASRDGELGPGQEIGVDVWISGGPTPTAVRFWVGSADARGSVKAKAAIEKDNWHTHVQVPTTLDPGAQLWVEIEGADGARAAGAYDLRR